MDLPKKTGQKNTQCLFSKLYKHFLMKLSGLGQQITD